MAPMIVVAGEALIDLLVHPDGRLAATPGGGPFNTARTIGRLDAEVAYLGCLSSDRFGSVLREAEIVSTRREAQTIYYSVCDPRIAKVLEVLVELFCPPKSDRSKRRRS